MSSLLSADELQYLQALEDAGDMSRAKRERDALLKKRNDMKSLLATDFGRSVVWDILSQCDIFGISMTGNAQTYYKEGRRSVGLELLSEVIASNPKAWIEIQQSNLEEIKNILNEGQR